MKTSYNTFFQEIGKILSQLCEWKGVRIVEAHAYVDHIHMLVEILPKMSVSSLVGFLKGKSNLMIFEKFANLKYKYGNRNFWCRRFYVDTVGKNKKAIEDYIINQEQEDMIADQISLKEYMDPFKGSK